MNTITKIACRTVGLVGLGSSLYNAARTSGHFSRACAQQTQANHLERTYFNARTLDTTNYTDNVIQEKTSNLLSRSPIPAIWGKIKGGFQGFMYGLGNSLPVLACSALALTCKNFGAKLGAVGVGLGFLYAVLREGFGFGKIHPMD